MQKPGHTPYYRKIRPDARTVVEKEDVSGETRTCGNPMHRFTESSAVETKTCVLCKAQQIIVISTELAGPMTDPCVILAEINCTLN